MPTAILNIIDVVFYAFEGDKYSPIRTRHFQLTPYFLFGHTVIDNSMPSLTILATVYSYMASDV